MVFAALLMAMFTLLMVLNERGQDGNYKRGTKKPLRPPASVSRR